MGTAVNAGPAVVSSWFLRPLPEQKVAGGRTREEVALMLEIAGGSRRPVGIVFC